MVGLKTFTNLFQAIGTVGLTGLDRLYSFMNVRLLQRFTDIYRRVVREPAPLDALAVACARYRCSSLSRAGDREVRVAFARCAAVRCDVGLQIKGEKGLNPFLVAFAAELEPVSALPPNSGRLYANALGKAGKLLAIFADHVTALGHVQLVRKMIGNELTVGVLLRVPWARLRVPGRSRTPAPGAAVRTVLLAGGPRRVQFRCKLNSSTLSNTISAMNDSLLTDIKNHYREYVRVINALRVGWLGLGAHRMNVKLGVGRTTL